MLVAVVSASAGEKRTTEDLVVLSGGTLIDGTGAEPVKDAVVVIRGERIEAAGPRGRVNVPAKARRIDVTGKWITPGLIDPHVHFFQSGGVYTRPDVIDLRAHRSYEQELTWIRQRLPYTFERYLCSGITSVVDVGGPMWNFRVREVANGTAEAPRVAVAGPLISTIDQEQLKTDDDPAIIRVDTPDQARALVDRELEKKPDLVKIWYIRRPDQKLEDTYPIVQATMEEAHQHGTRVAVHATELETAKAAVRLGADVLVHSVGNVPVDDEFVKMVKDRGVIYTTTLVVFEGYSKVLTGEPKLTDVDRTCGDPEVIATWGDLNSVPADRKVWQEFRGTARFKERLGAESVDKSMQIMKANLKRMQDAGAIVAAGTDAGNIGTLHGPDLHREFELMSEAGLTPMQILVDATQNAAKVFAAKPDIGTVQPGKYADLVVLNADPLADIKNARKIDSVVKAGTIYQQSELRVKSTP
jgi:imidazolonepropionase-like amidohydrolase